LLDLRMERGVDESERERRKGLMAETEAVNGDGRLPSFSRETLVGTYVFSNKITVRI